MLLLMAVETAQAPRHQSTPLGVVTMLPGLTSLIHPVPAPGPAAEEQLRPRDFISGIVITTKPAEGQPVPERVHTGTMKELLRVIPVRVRP